MNNLSTTYIKLKIRLSDRHADILLLYTAEKPSVRLSDRHADILSVSAATEMGLARNES